MGRLAVVSLKWVEVIVNLPTESTYQSGSALSNVVGLGFFGIGEPVDGVVSLTPRHFRTVLPHGTAGLPGATEVFLRAGEKPGMVIEYAGTGNQPVQVSVNNTAVGEVLSFPATELISRFDRSTGSHVGEIDLNLRRLAPQLGAFDLRTLKLRAGVTGAETSPPKGGLLYWLTSSNGALARRAVPGIASALTHNPDAAELGGRAWIAEIEAALAASTSAYLAQPTAERSEMAQLERLLAFVAAADPKL